MFGASRNGVAKICSSVRVSFGHRAEIRVCMQRDHHHSLGDAFICRLSARCARSEDVHVHVCRSTGRSTYVGLGVPTYVGTLFEVKGGAYSVTLHLYRRALAGVIARGLSLHKRSRLHVHFVRGSREEAATYAECLRAEAKSHFETGRCSEGDGFSARQSSREYGYYEQFKLFSFATTPPIARSA